MSRTAVLDQHAKTAGGSNANINQSKLSHIGSNAPAASSKASKQEIISEIKYHFSQEKEMKALAAAAARAQGQISPPNNKKSAGLKQYVS
tara:strand:- start:360 stop:629 length:270 start_codon:yes stop_codon:yes gene_type:complete